ncbi:MAG TPA: hypothetical protein VF526_02290 [Solirubrobacteraceae bacterium]|jgi:hypothetical protein
MRAWLISKQFRMACVGIVALALVVLAPPRLASSPSRTPRAASTAAPTTVASKYMLIDSARLALLPTSGAPYAAMKRTADDAMSRMSLTTPTATSPWLPNYGDDTGIGKGAATLAAALVYARTGDDSYRDFVIRVNRFVIGSEDSASTNGTRDEDKLLATMRQISAYVLAADLVGMDPDAPGSRPGYTSTVWKTWLGALRTKSIGSGNCSSIVDCNLKATNWGAWASASRTTIDVYLDDSADLAVAVDRLKLYLGESMNGKPWVRSESFDPSWACGRSVRFTAVNGSSCGSGKDGIIVEDASRSGAPFPNWDRAGIDYSFHAYGAQLVAALLLDRKGYDVWNWGDRALKRIMDRLDRLGVATGNGRPTATHVSWIARYFYNTDYPTVPARPSDTLGFTDWLYGAVGFRIGKLTRDRVNGSAALDVDVPEAGTLTVAGKGLRKVTMTPMEAGWVKLAIRPTVLTRKRLARTGHVEVRAKIRFSPSAGSPQARRTTIELVKKRA